MSSAATIITENHKDFLKFLKAKFPLYHLSNVFFRDVHYGVMAYLEQGKHPAGYTPAEKVAEEVVAYLEAQKILKPIDHKTWLLEYPEFKAVSAKKPAPAAKPAAAKPAGAAPAARPAVAPAKPAPAPTSPATPATTEAAPASSAPPAAKP